MPRPSCGGPGIGPGCRNFHPAVKVAGKGHPPGRRPPAAHQGLPAGLPEGTSWPYGARPGRCRPDSGLHTSCRAATHYTSHVPSGSGCTPSKPSFCSSAAACVLFFSVAPVPTRFACQSLQYSASLVFCSLYHSCLLFFHHTAQRQPHQLHRDARHPPVPPAPLPGARLPLFQPTCRSMCMCLWIWQ